MILAYVISFFCSGCKKDIRIDSPASSITTTEVFADSIDAVSAVTGMYSAMLTNGLSFGCGAISVFCGLSADELLPFNSSYIQLSDNSLIATNGIVPVFWTQAYPILYKANAIIEGVEASNGISESAKEQFIGEAKFFRAFIDLNLVNLYGEIPLINSTDYKSNALTSRSSVDRIYQQIIYDLDYAQSHLVSDYSVIGGDERVRVIKWAALALLARTYLYQNNWKSADSCATAVINSGLYSLADSLNGVFLKNSSEAILQWQINSSLSTTYRNGTPEGYNLVPLNASRQPNFYLSTSFLNAFETSDKRRVNWIDSSISLGKTYYYPYKYKIGPGQAVSNASVPQYYMVLRLAEQYLIRAEAEANGATGGISAAIADMNVIRNRAGLPNYSGASDETSVLNAIYHERRLELFAEWGHRWFDLKRTGQAHNVLSSIYYKQPWKGDYQLLYPIPLSELQKDPNLIQNPGY